MQQVEILTCVYYRRCFYFCDSYMQTDDGFSQEHPTNKRKIFLKSMQNLPCNMQQRSRIKLTRLMWQGTRRNRYMIGLVCILQDKGKYEYDFLQQYLSPPLALPQRRSRGMMSTSSRRRAVGWHIRIKFKRPVNVTGIWGERHMLQN